MFKEDYIKDNNRIKPDEDFLLRLREQIAEEELKMAKEVQNQQTAALEERWSEVRQDSKAQVKWIVAAACVVLIIIIGIMSDGISFSDSMVSLKGDMKSIFDGKLEQDEAEKNEHDESTDITLCKKQYQRLVYLFQQSEVVIYEGKDLGVDESGIEYLEQYKGDDKELKSADKDKMVEDILTGKYELKDNQADLGEAKYYVAEFENGSIARFAIDDEACIYIEEVSGIQEITGK